ncbi:MAG TPA: Ig-like domain-containing protein [Flavobacteriales bacterium]|nr:Ig-like domain-containing protein [Flavobacteriales bacterium]
MERHRTTPAAAGRGARVRFVITAGAALLLAACAQVREPQGGPKDTAAPQLLAAEPANGSSGFASNRIVLHFDERVKLDRVRERLLISPPLEKQPDVAVARGTDVVITLNAPLKEATTYTFNIGEAVLDLSEGNPAAGLTYVVSTGRHVDSLSLAGRVVDAFSGQPVPDALVLLHPVQDTGDVRTMPPAYFTRSAKDGRFKLTHLPAGPMYLTALVDRNGNFRYDLPTEEVAFLEHPVDPGDTEAYVLRLFRAASPTQFVVAAKVLPERGWQMVMARPAGELSLRSLDREGGRLQWWPEWNATRDTVVFWPSDTTLLNGQRFVLLEDTAALDSLTYRAVGAMPFHSGVTAKRHPVSGDWLLESTRPVGMVDVSQMRLTMDTLLIPMVVPEDSIHGRTIGLGIRPGPGNSAELVLYPRAIQAVMGGTNDTTRLVLQDPDPRSLGKLKLELTVDSTEVIAGPLLVQLNAGQGRTLREMRLEGLPAHVEWDGLPPGSYGIKLFRDRDGNGRWSTGDYDLRIPPEQVFLDPDPVVIRAGWVVERTWTLSGVR